MTMLCPNGVTMSCVINLGTALYIILMSLAFEPLHVISNNVAF